MSDFKKIITVLAIMIVILMTVFIHYARQYRDINSNSFIHDWLIVFFWIALISLGATLMSYAMYKLTKKK